MSYDIMKDIVASGSNLILEESVSYDLLRELVQMATRTGSQITIDGGISHDIIRELAAIGKGHVTFLVKRRVA